MNLVISNIKWKLYLVVAWYFQFFANLALKKWRPRVIAVTGSVGKTTLLNLLEIQLGKRAHYSHNANSIYGISFDILGLDGVRGSKLRWFYLFLAAIWRSISFHHQEELFVVEIDGERPKETERLASWLRPEITLWVSVGRTHAAHFDRQVAKGNFLSVDEAIINEFSYLPKYTERLVIYDADNKAINEVMSRVKVDSKGISSKSLKGYQVEPDMTRFETKSKIYHFAQPLPQEVFTQLAILEELAAYFNEAVATDLSGFVQPPGRSNYFAGIKQTKLIDSSYNAHLMSMQSIIKMYQAMKTKKKWIVIGDIVEQGEAEADEHTKLGEILSATQFDRYILVGRRTQKYTYPELDPEKTVSFLQPKHALHYLKQEIKGNETILFKGSQYLEGIVEQLLANPKDISKLPRQEAAAKKRRAEWGV